MFLIYNLEFRVCLEFKNLPFGQNLSALSVRSRISYLGFIPMKLSFYGAAGEVTGSHYLLEATGHSILVDCGLFQGDRFAEEKNFEEFPYDPANIQGVLVTHAHIDHIGRLPSLYKKGFRGKIFCTPPTKDLIAIALADSQGILDEEAREIGHEPLYTKEDVALLQEHIHPVDYETLFALGSFQVRLFNAGHILGSAMVEIKTQGKTIVFSGDIGNASSPLFNPPSIFEDVDYVVMESTYGDRLHDKTALRIDALENVVEDTVNRGGVLMIPAFALERTQEILNDLDALITQGRIPKVPVFVDSPLAVKATEIYKKYPDYYRPDIQEQVRQGQTIFQFPGLVFAQSVDESKRINDVPPPKIIMAGSGMSQGGRILHHERRYLPDPKSTLLIVGYQTQGSRGRRILEGAKAVSLFGEQTPVRCRVARIDEYSAHADKNDLVNWARSFKDRVKTVFLTHGEQEGCEKLAYELKDLLGINVQIPARGQSIPLS